MNAITMVQVCFENFKITVTCNALVIRMITKKLRKRIKTIQYDNQPNY